MRDEELASLIADYAFAAAIVPIQLPSRIGENDRYELQELIAYGPRSHVYRAIDRRFTHEDLISQVIVKITNSPTRGVLDALSARRVESPYVVRVLDRGELPDGTHFIVLEWARHGDLAGQKLPWAPRKAAQFMAELTSAVQAAHSAGIVHCDLKPGNVLVSETGEPRLSDFDLSARIQQAPYETRGNRAFAPLEQIHGEEGALSPRADIYALGGLLYYVLSGKLPNGETADQIHALHHGLRDRPPLNAPEPLAAIASRALAAKPADRYETAEQFAADLRAWLEHRPLPSRSTSVLSRARLWCMRSPTRAVLSAVLALTLVAAVILGMAWFHSEKTRELKSVLRANELANAEIASLKGARRREFEGTATVLAVLASVGSPERMAVVLDMVQQLERPGPAAGDIASTASVQRDLLARIIAEAETQGRSAHMDVQLARLQLALAQLRQNQPEEALKVLDAAQQHWGNRLLRGEAIEQINRLLQLSAQAMSQRAAGQDIAEATRTGLIELRAEVAKSKQRECIPIIIDRVLKGVPIDGNSDTGPRSAPAPSSPATPTMPRNNSKTP